MINTIVNMPSEFYGGSITLKLEQTGKFRVRNLTRGDLREVLASCREMCADVVLLGVSVIGGYTLPERTEAVREVRKSFPECKIVLFVDESVSAIQTEGVKALKQALLIDDFLYASVSMDYIEAKLETIV